MAKHRTTDNKAKKQKLVLAGCGALLLLLAALQGPKLMKQLNPPAPAPAAAPAPATATAPSGSTPPATSARPAVVRGGSTTLVAGVAVSSQGAPAAGEGQLRSFTLFATKDPFVPQVSDIAPGGTAPSASSSPAPTKAPAPSPAPSAAPPSTTPAAVPGSGATSTPPVVPEPAPTNATMLVNGSPQALVLKDTFPKPDPLFVLVSLKKKVAKVGVAGGTFASGSTIALKLGSPVTVVNDATGARYVLELVYTGAAPEQVATFTAPAPAPTPAKK